MAHTDKTDPYQIRHKGDDQKFTNAERLVVGPDGIRFAKRYRSKKNRRRTVPLSKMSGYGYGYENYRYCFQD